MLLLSKKWNLKSCSATLTCSISCSISYLLYHVAPFSVYYKKKRYVSSHTAPWNTQLSPFCQVKQILIGDVSMKRTEMIKTIVFLLDIKNEGHHAKSLR